MSAAKVFPWPELSPNELAGFYAQIKENKTLDINWTNPGRVDPELVFAKLKSQKNAEKGDENEKSMEDQEAEAEFEDANDVAVDMNDEFDMFDEFNSDEKCTKDKISELRLKHSTTRDTKKVASMDKILFDIKKKIETEEYIRKHSTDDASSILSETGAGELKKPDSVDSCQHLPAVVDIQPSPKPTADPLPGTSSSSSSSSKPSSPKAAEVVQTLEEQPAPTVTAEPAPQDQGPQPMEQEPEKAAQEEMAVDLPISEPVPSEPVQSTESLVEQPVVEQAQELVVEAQQATAVEAQQTVAHEAPQMVAVEDGSKSVDETPIDAPAVEPTPTPTPTEHQEPQPQQAAEALQDQPAESQ